MVKNMGTADRVIRAIIAVVLLYLAFGTNGFAASGFWHWLFIIIAVIFGFTAIFGNCPLYRVFGVNTRK